MNIVSIEDVKNEYGYDLLQVLNLPNASLVDNWIKRREREVKNYIAEFCFFRKAQVEAYIANPNTLPTIKEAILNHIEFILINKQYIPSQEMDRTLGEQQYTISKSTHDILASAGLLYAGARWY